MMNGWIKIFSFSLFLWMADRVSPQITYPSYLPLLATAFVLTCTGLIADRLIVPALGNIPSTLLGLVGISLIIWGVAWLWPGVHVPLLYAFLISLPMGIIEFILHRYVSPKTVKM
jgi:hypothetical protein